MKRHRLLMLASAVLVLGTLELLSPRTASAASMVCSSACIPDDSCTEAQQACGPQCPVGTIIVDASCPDGFEVDCTFDSGAC
jgi:hypothetical protein